MKDFAKIRSFLPRKIFKGKTLGFGLGFGFFKMFSWMGKVGGF